MVHQHSGNRARLEAEQEWAIIRERVDTEMSRQQYCIPGAQCHVSGNMEHRNHPSTLATQGGRSLCSMEDFRSQAAAAHIIKVIEKAEEPEKDSGVEE